MGLMGPLRLEIFYDSVIQRTKLWLKKAGMQYSVAPLPIQLMSASSHCKEDI